MSNSTAIHETPEIEEKQALPADNYGILANRQLFEGFISEVKPHSMTSSRADTNDFDTFWDSDGWGNGGGDSWGNADSD